MQQKPSVLAALFSLLILAGCFNKETYRGSWMINVDNKPVLLTYTHYYHGGKSTSEYDYFRLINPETGNIQGEAEYNVRGKSISNKFITTRSLFIETDKEWECRNLKNLELRWDHEGLLNRMQKLNPSVARVHSINYYNDVFTVTNTAGEVFRFSRYDLEGVNGISINSSLLEPYYYYSFDRKELPVPKNIDSIAEERINEIIERSQNKVGITVNRHVVVLAGENRKTLLHLDTTSLTWSPVLNDRTWLQGDFLRPYNKRYGSVVSSGKEIYLFYHTSLDKEEDDPHLASINITDRKLTWDISLEKMEMENDYHPVAGYNIDNTLIVVWINNWNNYHITGISVTSGKTKWSYTN